MKKSREEVLADVLTFLRDLADDWGWGGNIDQDTCFFADMGLESLDVVVLATAVQQHYGQVLPFPEFFAEIGQRDRRDVSVGEWVDFIYEHLDDLPSLKPEDSAKP